MMFYYFFLGGARYLRTIF